MLKAEIRTEIYQDYTADYLWGIRADIHGMMGDEFTAMRFTEIMHPEQNKRDNRSAEEIKDNVLKRLTA